MPDLIPIAYLTSQYPRASDTFIRVEVQQLRRRGFDVQTFSIRRPDGAALVDEQVRSEMSRTTYLLDRGITQTVAALGATILARPLRLAAAVALMWRTGAPGWAARVKHLAYLLEAVVLSRLLRQRRLRHIHNHIGENSATVAMLASAISGVPFSLSIHGPHIFFHPRQWALGEKICRARFTACISHFCQSQCMVFAPQSHWNRLKLVRCCVSPAFLSAEAVSIPEEPRFVFVGRLSPEKGVPLLVDAVHQLAEDGLNPQLKLIGDGPLRDTLREDVRRRGLENCIEFLGWQSSGAVREHILNARALVLPSFSEGLPVVLMEAMAIGRPVVTTQIAGIGELVEAGVHGWLIPPASTEALADAMRQVITTATGKLASMGRAGMQKVHRQHHPAAEITKLASHLRQSLDEVGEAT